MEVVMNNTSPPFSRKIDPQNWAWYRRVTEYSEVTIVRPPEDIRRWDRNPKTVKDMEERPKPGTAGGAE